MGLFDRRKKNTKTAMCISGKLRTASLTSQVGMVLDCRKPTEDEGCPDYEDSPYMEIIKRSSFCTLSIHSPSGRRMKK